MNLIKFLKELKFYTSQQENKKLFYLICSLFIVSEIIGLIFAPAIVKILIACILFFIFLAIVLFYKNIAEKSFNNFVKYTELKAVIENIEDGIIIYDTNFKIIDFNPAAQKIFGLNPEEIINKTITPDMVQNPHLKILTQILFPSLAPSINTITDSGWPKIVEINFEEPHLKLKTFLNQVINQENNQVVAFIKIIQDETRESDILQSKSEFLTVSAHQLRTPLTALSWTLESLKKSLENKDISESTKLAGEAWNLIQRSLKIIEDLLNAAKIEEGRFGFNFQEINFGKLLEDILKDLSPILNEYKISLESKIQTNELKISADEEKLKMAINNILENAIKYNVPNGSISVLVEDDENNPHNIKVSISDTGIGIPKESIPKMFGKFYRAENAQRAEPNGNGLGLYITKNIIEKHGGKIYVESQLKRGTTFYFTLPKVK